MAKGNKMARIVQDATGAKYMTCLKKLEAFQNREAREAYLDRVEAIPDERCGTKDDPLCLDCLAPNDGWHACPGEAS